MASSLINNMFCNDLYAAACIAWQSPAAVERTGPAVVVSATGGWGDYAYTFLQFLDIEPID